MWSYLLVRSYCMKGRTRVSLFLSNWRNKYTECVIDVIVSLVDIWLILGIHQCEPFGEWLFIFPTQCQIAYKYRTKCHDVITLSSKTLNYNPVPLTSAHTTALLLTDQLYRKESALQIRCDLIWTPVVKAICQNQFGSLERINKHLISLFWSSNHMWLYSFALGKREFPVQNYIDLVHESRQKTPMPTLSDYSVRTI